MPFQYKTIEGNSTFTTTLTELKKYVLYGIKVLAFTRKGDGALTRPPIAVKTFEDGKLALQSLYGCFGAPRVELLSQLIGSLF